MWPVYDLCFNTLCLATLATIRSLISRREHSKARLVWMRFCSPVTVWKMFSIRCSKDWRASKHCKYFWLTLRWVSSSLHYHLRRQVISTSLLALWLNGSDITVWTEWLCSSRATFNCPYDASVEKPWWQSTLYYLLLKYMLRALSVWLVVRRVWKE